jgi:hypothetical protein
LTYLNKSDVHRLDEKPSERTGAKSSEYLVLLLEFVENMAICADRRYLNFTKCLIEFTSFNT